MTVDVWTLLVAIATLIVSILAYCFSRRSSRENQKQIAALKKQQKVFFDSYNERIKAKDKRDEDNAEMMLKATKEESKRMKALSDRWLF